jgi:hypothetical protein
MMSKCIQLCRDCTNICVTASQFMSRGSEHAKQLCNICAVLCDDCGAECEKIRPWNTVNNVLKHVENALQNVA